MKVVLLAGGFGSRISEESQFKPKPMIEIGGMPILWHIMKEYAHFGHTEFIICAGYNTMTGGRIKRIQEYVGSETFMMTYGDGVCDVDINKLLEFHKAHGRKATLTAVKMKQEKGVLDITKDMAVRSFREKNSLDGSPINAGYMVLEPSVFDYIDGDSQAFEREPLEKLADEGELMSYIHEGFWQCMDNVREKAMLEKFLAEDKAPWKRWNSQTPEIPDYAK